MSVILRINIACPTLGIWIKVFLDGRFVYEGNPANGLSFDCRLAPGMHRLELKRRSALFALFGASEKNFTFDVHLGAPGRYEVNLGPGAIAEYVLQGPFIV